MTMPAKQKQELDHLVGIYLSGLESISNDAGWEGLSMAARMIEFKGEPPPPSGNDQADLAMIHAIRLLRKRHAKWPLICSAMWVMQQHKWSEALAIMAKNYFIGQSDITGRAYTDQERATMIDMDLRAYRYNLEKAYFTLQSDLDRVRAFMVAFGVGAEDDQRYQKIS
jgi:hypothetical protein